MDSEKPKDRRATTEFERFVKESLQELKDRQADIEKRIDDHIELTRDIGDIVKMGKGMFAFAARIGSAIRWIGGVIGGCVILWNIIMHWFKDGPKPGG